MANLVPLSNFSIIKPKTSGIVKVDKFLASKPKSSSEIVKYSDKSSKTSEGDDILKQIQKKVVKIDKLLKGSLLLSKKEDEKKRVSKEQKDFDKKEAELEKKKPKSIPGIKLPSLPKMGFLDWIKNFITQTILGFFAVRLIEYLPKLLKLLPVVLKAGEFLINIGGKLLDGLVTFIDWGYKAYDATRGFVKNIFGEGGVKQFDNLMSTLNTLSSVIILASLASAGGGKGGPGRGGGKGGGGVGIRGAKDVAGRSRYGTTAEAARRYSQRFGRDAAIKKFGEKGVRSLGGRYARSGATNLARNALVGLAGKGGAKAILGTVRPLLKRLPIIGALLDFGLSVALGEDPGRAAFKAIGAGLLGTLGAAIGSVVPIAGNLLGGLIGGVAGDAIGGALYDMFFGGKKPQQSRGKVAKAAGGGKPTTRGGKLVSGGSTRRTLKKKKKPRTVSFTPRKIKPGANTGGEAKVQSVFPNPEKAWWDPLGVFTGKKQQTQQQKPQKPKGKQPNPQQFLVGSNDVLGRAKYFIGPTATLVLKTVLGQQPDDLDYKNIAKGLNSFVQTTFGGETLGFAGGGEVDARQYFSGEDYTDVIAKTIKDSAAKEVDTTIRNLSKELALRPAVGREEMLQENIRRGTESGGEDGGGDLTSGQWGPLLDLISGKESGGNYEAMYPSTTLPGATKMTIAEVARRATGAVGKYQQLPQYLVGRAKAAGLNPDKDLYSPENQEKIIINVNIKGRGGEKWLKGEISDEQFMQGLSQEFASLPNAQGKFYYPGQRSSMTPEKVKSVLSKVKKGGYSKQELDLGRRSTDLGKPGAFVKQPPGGRIVTSGMGNRSLALSPGMHMGVDISGNTGEHLKAFTDGVIEDVGKDGGYGNYVNWIDSSGIAHFYAHMNKPAFVRKGQRVKKGTVLGELGSTGRSSGPHLHWEAATNPRDTGMSKSAVLSRFNPLSRYSKESPFTGARFHGGPILKTGNFFGHKGEFVIDKDSVDLFGVDFIDSINSIENQSQLVVKAPSIIEKLKAISGYTEDDMPTQTVYVYLPSSPEVLPVPVGSGGPVFVVGSVNNNDMQALEAIG